MACLLEKLLDNVFPSPSTGCEACKSNVESLTSFFKSLDAKKEGVTCSLCKLISDDTCTEFLSGVWNTFVGLDAITFCAVRFDIFKQISCLTSAL
ncbi:hypothetical protein CRM22_002721 [Opisthorchis felineus]|uniref:Uncharacterized protein n=1 Tax=Opisthorchis felineus TaxID=147828 RepID=A0A4S2M4R0_OPIFE|nr:hypothetical protein CRM22_002721 [Opisthorchis felineus]TGZ71312.1 hypothetical protein CRM22_002721 [Opisthorchis felineus]